MDDGGYTRLSPETKEETQMTVIIILGGVYVLLLIGYGMIKVANKPILKEKAMSDLPYSVCLCGSTRFIGYFAWMQWQLEQRGVFAFGLHLIPDANIGDPPPADHAAEYAGVADMMDAMHFRKIELSNEVLVLSIGGYIGESTSREIAHAKSLEKPIKYVINEEECIKYLAEITDMDFTSQWATP